MHTTITFITIAALLASVVSTSSCAIFNIDKTPMLRAVDENLMPARDSSWRGVAVIVMLPVGIIAAIIDQVLVIPVAETDDAYRDTKTALWTHFDHDEHYVTEMALVPFRAVATPIVFVGDLLARTIFDIPAHPRDGESNEGTSRAINIRINERDDYWAANPDEVEDAEADPLQELDDAISAGDKDRALALITAAWRISSHVERERYEELVVDAVTQLDLKSEKKVEVLEGRHFAWVDGDHAETRLMVMMRLMDDDDPTVRRATMKILGRGFPDGSPLVASLAEDEDAFVCLEWLEVMGQARNAQTKRGKLTPAFLAQVQRLANEDPEAQVRAEAKRILRRFGQE